MRKTKIVCTIGPATKDVKILKELIKEGKNVARINFSHGSYPEQKVYIDAVKEASEAMNMPIALLLDMQGPEVRTGILEENSVILEENEEFILMNKDIIGDKTKTSVSYKNLYKDIKKEDTILIDDGALELKVTKIKNKDIYCKVIIGGKLGNRKSINVPGIHLNLPAISEKDKQDLSDAVKAKFDYVAASFVRSADDIMAIRKCLSENDGEKIKIIAKIENQEGIDNFEKILDVSDGIMVARGDLGVEVPFEQVPILQKYFIKECNRRGKLVITATQMLESMMNSSRPTRAEVSDVANAIFDITGAIMLSGESALGNYPIDCVKTMNKISLTIEKSLKYWKRFRIRDYDLKSLNQEFGLNYSVCTTAMNMNAKAIFAYTDTGDTPRIVSSFLPECPIFAITRNEKTYKQLSLAWGVTPLLIRGQKSIDDMIRVAIEAKKKDGFLKHGDTIVIAGGSTVVPDLDNGILNRMIGGVLKI